MNYKLANMAFHLGKLDIFFDNLEKRLRCKDIKTKANGESPKRKWKKAMENVVVIVGVTLKNKKIF